MSSKGAKRSRRVAGEAPEASVAGGEGGARDGGLASAATSAAPASSTAIVRSRRRSATAAADDADSASGMVAPGITVAEISRFVEEQLRAVQRDMEAARRDHARELAAVRRELSVVHSDHSRELAAVRSDHARGLAAVRRDHARDLTAVRRDHSRLASDHALLASKVADLRYDNSHLCALVKSSIDHTEVDLAMVCRRFGSGPDAYREYRSVMSVLFNAHAYDLSEGFMRFFTTREARELRLVHSEFLEAVNATPWHDMETIITGPLAAWRACFPNAQAANVDGREDLVDADFVHFRGLRSLDMTDCKGILDAAFVNLRGIDSLIVAHCNEPGITPSAFANLKGIQELDMEGCSLAVTTAAFDLLQGARSLIPSLANNLVNDAIEAADVPECRRLLVARALGSACWLYAGVTFRDLFATASTHDTIATACIELLQVGLEVKCSRIVSEAAGFIVGASLNELGEASCVAAGAIPALIAALGEYGADLLVCRIACAAFSNIASGDEGRIACEAAGAALPITSTLKRHAASAFVMVTAFDAMINMSCNSSANVASFVSLGAISLFVAAFQKCSMAVSLCESFSHALCNIACFPCGVEACLACGAVPLLAAAYTKHKPARVQAKEALRHLGYDCKGALLAGR